MNRWSTAEHLTEAEAHVAKGQQIIAQQRALIDSLKSGHHDTRMAQELLEQFEAIQALHIEHCERCRKALGQNM
jgi:hypothetical protein